MIVIFVLELDCFYSNLQIILYIKNCEKINLKIKLFENV